MIRQVTIQLIFGRIQRSTAALGLALGLAVPASAQVANYDFDQSAGTYSQITGGNVLVSGTFDNAVYTVNLANPGVIFNGTVYNTMYVSTNGFITFGSAASTTNYTPISSSASYVGAIAAFGARLENATSGTREIRAQRIGAEVIVQWRDVRREGISGGERFSFQVRMNTTNGEIRVVYGPLSNQSSSTDHQPQVGLRGANNTFATNVNNRMVTTGSNNWPTSLQGTSNSSTCRFKSGFGARAFTEGLTYTWTPCVAPAATVAVGATDCVAGTYEATVNVTSLGSAPNVSLVANPGGTLLSNVGVGSHTVNLPLGTVSLTLVHNGTPSCDLDLGNVTHAMGCVNNGQCYGSTALPQIPDNGCGSNNYYEVGIGISGLPNTLSNAALGTLLESVDLIVAHTYRGDLRIHLVSPQGQQRDLFLRKPSTNASGDNLGSTFNCPNGILKLQDGAAALTTMSGSTNSVTGTFAPEQTLAGFTGNPNGTWILRICDAAAQDVGRLRHVKLNFAQMDCLGTLGGSTLPGSACDDNDACTTGDVYDANCNCAGTYSGDSDNDGVCDALDQCPGSPEPGMACDDNDPCTINDTVDANCNCAGTYSGDSDNDGVCDALDVCPGSPEPGMACNDGNPFTLNDTVDATCNCVGTPVPCDNWTFTLVTDGAAAETSWQLKDANSAYVLASGAGYPNNASISSQVCVPHGACLELTVNDAGNNGIAGGGWMLVDGMGRRVLDNMGNGGAFTTSCTSVAEAVCHAMGSDRLIMSNCDREDHVANGTLAATPNAAVTAQWGIGDQTDDGYQFWFFDPAGDYSRRIFRNHATSGGFAPADGTRACRLSLASIVANPLPQNTLLNVRVRSRVNGVNAEWGPACRFRIGTVACPTTRLIDDPNSSNYSCGVTRAFGGSDKLYCYPVTGATQYRWRFSNPDEGYVRNITTSVPAVVLNWATLPLANFGQYTVTVQTSLDGGNTWCAFGNSCNLLIVNPPAAQGRMQDASTQDVLRMWPNPTTGDGFELSWTGMPMQEGSLRVDVLDMSGRLAHAEQLGVMNGEVRSRIAPATSLPTGTYLVVLTMGEHHRHERLVVH